jgi:hypothetical protein
MSLGIVLSIETRSDSRIAISSRSRFCRSPQTWVRSLYGAMKVSIHSEEKVHPSSVMSGMVCASVHASYCLSKITKELLTILTQKSTKRSGRQLSDVGGCRRQRVGDGGVIGPCRHASFAGIAVALHALVIALGAIASHAIVTGTCTSSVFAE